MLAVIKEKWMSKILLVEDSRAMSEPLSYLLEREGMTVEVVERGDLVDAAFDAFEPDLVLLDIMLPGKSGIDVCRELRKRSSVPIVMLTAKDTELDIVLGLEAGADDYVVKPYSASELVARIRAGLRRQERSRQSLPQDTDRVSAAGVTVNVDSHDVTVEGKSIYLPLKEFELLSLMVTNAGRVLTRGQLLDEVWGNDYYGDTKTLDVHVKRLRSKVEPDPRHPVRILTIRGLGYKFVDRIE